MRGAVADSSRAASAAQSDRPLRVLHLGKYYPPHPGGMETYLRDLLDALQSPSLQCMALVHASRPGLRSEEDSAAAGVAPRVVRAATLGTLLFAPVSPAFAWQLWRLIRREQPDILHLHMPNVSAFWALLLPSARRLPWVVHWHADVPLSEHRLALRVFYRLYRPFEWLLLRRARHIVVTSPPYRDSSPALSGFRHKCRVVPLGLRPPDAGTADQGEPAARPADGPGAPDAGALRVLAVGRLTYYKGFDRLIRALALCPEARLDLVGDGEELSRLQALVRELQLEARVRLWGNAPQAELARLLQCCDCLCLPSVERTEAFGMVLLEAMARGKPCVATAVPGSGMAWVVAHGQTGLVVPPDDPAALAAALSALARDPRQRVAMGERGRQRFRDCFGIQASAAGILALYQQSLHA